jgi:DNA mismatch endonuclease (patch repair protein)
VFGAQRVAIFVDGCFWHGCPVCRRAPNSNQAYWERKVDRNRRRDRRITRRLRKEHWKVVRIWEHQLQRSPSAAVRKIVQAAGRVLN